jgi:hypothetical protein
MEIFYIVVLSISISLLILVLAFYGIFMNSNIKNSQAYPPQPAPNCPDYWTVTPTGECNIPTPGSNAKNLGNIFEIKNTGSYGGNTLTSVTTPGLNSKSGTIDFNNKEWNTGGVGAVCNQKTWANSINVVWDGVSNYNGC